VIDWLTRSNNNPNHHHHHHDTATECLPEIPVTTGTAVTDRKSKFVAHVARITCERDALQVVAALKRNNKKIATATHNIVAYRYIDAQSGQLV
jgi:hypothetical protein